MAVHMEHYRAKARWSVRVRHLSGKRQQVCQFKTHAAAVHLYKGFLKKLGGFKRGSPVQGSGGIG